MILYQPMNVNEVVGNNISQISNQDMVDYYADYITEYKFKSTTWYIRGFCSLGGAS
jgi:hypothetical protein